MESVSPSIAAFIGFAAFGIGVLAGTIVAKQRNK